MSNIFTWLSSDNYRTYNVEAAKRLGSVYAAIILSELVQRFKYHESRNELITDSKKGGGWFYFTHDKCEDRTGLSRKEQDTAICCLERNNLIEKVLIGVPAKRHFKFKEKELEEFFNFQKNILDCPKGANWIDPKGQTGHIYKEPKEEPKRTLGDCACVSDSSSTEPDKQKGKEKKKHGSHVKLSDDELQALQKEHGTPLVAKMIDEMNDYCSSTKPKGYLDYAAAIRQWIRRKSNEKGSGNGKNVKESIKSKQLDEYMQSNGGFESNVLRFE